VLGKPLGTFDAGALCDAGAGAGTPLVSMSLIEPSSTEKSTLVIVA
jgi:hypothetical protein